MGLGNGLAWQTRKVPKAATFFRFAIDIRAEISQGCKRYATEKSEPREGKMPHSTRLYTAGVAGAAQARRVALNVQGSSQQGVQSLPAKQAITGTAETQIHRSGSCECRPAGIGAASWRAVRTGSVRHYVLRLRHHHAKLDGRVQAVSRRFSDHRKQYRAGFILRRRRLRRPRCRSGSL
jgi:hypothetical protein